MKIAYIIYPDVIISNKSNGIRSQAMTWASQLRTRGVIVDLIDNWSNYDWKSYEIIHIFRGGPWMPSIVSKLKKNNPNIVWSPIIDPVQYMSPLQRLNEWLKKCISCIVKTNYYYNLSSVNMVKGILTRSQFEDNYIRDTYKNAKGKTWIVPLSISPSCEPYIKQQKENYCFHVSSLYRPKKNVLNLVKAAKKYGFELVLAGNTGTQSQFETIKKEIGESKNIKVLGFITEEEKIELYKKAKVFALPSFVEGVGIVALDAAFYGCEVVISNIKGPKEYYNGKCIEVNPKSVDEIGKAIMSFMNDEVKYQPELSSFVAKDYSNDSITDLLLSSYDQILHRN